MLKEKKRDILHIVDKIINKFINIIIPSLIIMIPIIFILYLLDMHKYISIKLNFIVHLNVLYQYLMYILGGIYIYKIIKKEVRITKSDIFLFVFMFITILSTICAYDKTYALYGSPGRNEGLYTLLFYCFLYLNCKLLSTKINIKILMKIMVFISIFHFIFVLWQLSGLCKKYFFLYNAQFAPGITNNANFLGSLMCLFAIICVGGYLLYNKKKDSFYFLFFLAISYSVLLLTNVTGPFLSFIFSFVLLVFTLIIKKRIKYKKVLIVIVLLITLYPICLNKKNKIIDDIKDNLGIINNVVFNKDNKSLKEDLNSPNSEIKRFGSERGQIWINVWKLIEEKPLIGYGPDNLGLVYVKNFYDKQLIFQKRMADKAHNIYLHIWVTSGLFAMLSYIFWLLFVVYQGIKSKDDTVTILCFAIIAYCIQGLVNINVIEVTPYFYLVVGFMMFLINEKKVLNN